MTFSASKSYETGMSVPPSVRRDVALRLLESVEPDRGIDSAAEDWLRTDAAAAYDALEADPSCAVPAERLQANVALRGKCVAVEVDGPR